MYEHFSKLPLSSEYLASNTGETYVEWFPQYFIERGWYFVRVSSKNWHLATEYCVGNFKRDEWESYYASFAFKNRSDAVVFKLTWSGDGCSE